MKTKGIAGHVAPSLTGEACPPTLENVPQACSGVNGHGDPSRPNSAPNGSGLPPGNCNSADADSSAKARQPDRAASDDVRGNSAAPTAVTPAASTDPAACADVARSRKKGKRAAAAKLAKASKPAKQSRSAKAERSANAVNGHRTSAASRTSENEPRDSGDPSEIPPGEAPLPDHPSDFVEEIHRKIDLTEVWHGLLRSRDPKIRQRAAERLTDIKYKLAANAPEEPPQIIFDIPRPIRD